MSDDGPSMSEMMDMADVYEKIQEGDLSQEDWEEIQEEIDVEQVLGGVQGAALNVVGPHLDDIRNLAQQPKLNGHPNNRQYARKVLEGMEVDQQDQEFEEMVGELVTIAAMVRVDPMGAGRELKQYVRNPWAMERLLLIFNDPAFVDDAERVEELKELTTKLVRWFSMQLIPGAYTYEERAEIQRELGRGVPDVDQQPPQSQGQWQGRGR